MKTKKTIAIIGAGPGVGLAIARKFGKEGFSVALIGRNKEKLAELVQILNADGIQTSAYPADVTKQDTLVAALSEIIAEYGGIDVLEYGPSPAMDQLRTIQQLDAESASYQFSFNVLGAIAAVNTVLPHMQSQKDGAILFTTAVSAQHPLNLTASFGIAAGAQLNYARLLHDNLKADNIYAGIVSIAAMVAVDGAFPADLAANFPADFPVISADEVADKHWSMYNNRDICEATVGNVDAILAVAGLKAN